MSSTSARIAGVLSRIAAAGHTTRQVEIETPDGAPMRLTFIDAGQRHPPGPQAQRAARHRARSPSRIPSGGKAKKARQNGHNASASHHQYVGLKHRQMITEDSRVGRAFRRVCGPNADIYEAGAVSEQSWLSYDSGVTNYCTFADKLGLPPSRPRPRR